MVGLLIEEAVREQSIYGRWRIEGRVGNSRRHVEARCLDCNNLYTVDLFELRRKDRQNKHCRSCSNKVISDRNKLPVREALLRNQLHEYKKAAAKRNYSWAVPIDVFNELIVSDCFYCGAKPSRMIESSWDSMLVSGIDRRVNSAGYTVENVVPCCKDCNYAKRVMSAEQFIDLCERVANHAKNSSNRP